MCLHILAIQEAFGENWSNSLRTYIQSSCLNDHVISVNFKQKVYQAWKKTKSEDALNIIQNNA